jgi:hypothetical protein
VREEAKPEIRESERERGARTEDGGEEEEAEGGRRPGASALADAACAAALSTSREIGRKGEGGEGKRQEKERGRYFLPADCRCPGSD